MITPRKHLEAVHRGFKGLEGRHDSLRLDLNELVPHLEQDVFEHLLRQISPSTISAYPEVKPLYDALSSSLGFACENVLITSGSDSAIRHVIEAFCDPGDTVVITYPTYFMYEVYTQVYGLNCIRINYCSDFTISYCDLSASLTCGAKVIAIANPNGIIGSIIPEPILRELIEAASKRSILVVLDEAYVQYYVDHWSQLIDRYDNLVLLRTFSKAAGLAGLRLGYILTNGYLRQHLDKVRPVIEVNSIAALFGAYIVNNPQVTDRAVQLTIEGKKYLTRELRKLGFEVYEGYANFVLVKLGPHRKAVLSRFDELNIRVSDLVEAGPAKDYTRITAGPTSDMEFVVNTVRAAM
jgi:histidinol-phosphate aminotransferase